MQFIAYLDKWNHEWKKLHNIGKKNYVAENNFSWIILLISNLLQHQRVETEIAVIVLAYYFEL